MKIATFNIRCDYGQDGDNNFRYRKPLILEKLAEEKPDIVCFQEVLPHAARPSFSMICRMPCSLAPAPSWSRWVFTTRNTRFVASSSKTASVVTLGQMLWSG